MTHDCIHEEQIVSQSQKLAELETKNGFKDQRINELIEDNKRIEEKIDNLTKTVNEVIVNSIKDDNDLNNRVIALETQIQTQNDVLEKYKKEAKDQRDEDRQKLNLRLTAISVGLALLIFALTYVFK